MELFSYLSHAPQGGLLSFEFEGDISALVSYTEKGSHLTFCLDSASNDI
ncbi:MAG: hypothetical protein R2744_13520 [Bacteroidales bacterium]